MGRSRDTQPRKSDYEDDMVFYGEPGRNLSRGKQAVVREVTIDGEPTDIVCKEFVRKQECVKEWVIANSMNHPNIIAPVALELPSNRIYMQKYDYSLHEWISHPNRNPDDNQFVIQEVMNGLAYMHENDACHSDINPYNVLVNVDRDTGRVECAVICDFGVSCINKYSSPNSANYMYRDPNSMTGWKHDIYSLGVMIIQLYANKNDWMSYMKEVALQRPSLNHVWQKVSSYMSCLPQKLVRIVKSMISNNEADRLSVVDYMRQLGWETRDVVCAFRKINMDEIVSARKDISDRLKKVYDTSIPRWALGYCGALLYIELKPEANEVTVSLACSYIMHSVFGNKKIGTADVDKEVFDMVNKLVRFTNFVMIITTPSNLAS